MSAPSSSRRRTAVAKHPGVYYREGANGKRRYEISFSDSEGRRRWKVIEGGLREAQAALDDVKQRRRKGKRVAPTRATRTEVAEQWLAMQTQLRPRTRERYEVALRCHVLPWLGRLRIAEINEEHVARLVAAMHAGLTISRDERGRLVEKQRTICASRRSRAIMRLEHRRLRHD